MAKTLLIIILLLGTPAVLFYVPGCGGGEDTEDSEEVASEEGDTDLKKAIRKRVHLPMTANATSPRVPECAPKGPIRRTALLLPLTMTMMVAAVVSRVPMAVAVSAGPSVANSRSVRERTVLAHPVVANQYFDDV